MFRFLLTFWLIGLAWLFLDARWEPQDRLLSVRVRTTEEIRAQAFERARDLGREWVRGWAEGQRTGAVSAPAPADGSEGSELRAGVRNEPRP